MATNRMTQSLRETNGSSPKEIERDIERIRHEMDETLDEIGERLHPKHLLEAVMELFRSSEEHPAQGREYARQAAGMAQRGVRKVQENPGPALLIGAGLAWWLYSEFAEEDELRERSGSLVDARTGQPYDESYGTEWTTAWPGEEEEPTWTQRAQETFAELGTMLGDSSRSAKDSMRAAANKILNLSGRKRERIHAQWANLREHSGSFVDARTGEPYDDSYGEEWQHLAACDYAANCQWPQEHEEAWSDKARETLEKMRTSLSDTGMSARDRARALSARIGEFISSTGGIATDYSSRVRSSIGSGARRRAGQMRDVSRRTASRVGQSAKDGYASGRDLLSQTFEESPLAVGAACLGLGLIAGLILPRTRAEDEWMGEASDEAKSRAREVGEDVLQRGERVVERAAEASKEELRNQQSFASTETRQTPQTEMEI